MVYNVGGGNKSKGLARKFVVQSSASGNGGGPGKTVRVVKEEGEQYAIVQKHLGNCMCTVYCSDGYRRLCIIRKKFTGRRKTDNNISSGSVVLVGLHDYSMGGSSESSKGAGDIKRCDLLYVYSEQEKEKLRKVCDLSKLSSSLEDASSQKANQRHSSSGQEYDASIDVAFITSGTGVFNKYAKDEARRQTTTISSSSSSSSALASKNIISSSDWLDDMPSDNDDDDINENDSTDNDSNDSNDNDKNREESEEEEEEEEKPYQYQYQQKSKPITKEVIDVDDI